MRVDHHCNDLWDVRLTKSELRALRDALRLYSSKLIPLSLEERMCCEAMVKELDWAVEKS